MFLGKMTYHRIRETQEKKFKILERLTLTLLGLNSIQDYFRTSFYLLAFYTLLFTISREKSRVGKRASSQLLIAFDKYPWVFPDVIKILFPQLSLTSFSRKVRLPK